MEKPPLEKIIGMLEKIDIREWKWVNNRLFIRAKGMTVYLYDKEQNPLFTPKYCLELTNEEDIGRGLEYGSSKKEKGIVRNFYQKINEAYDKYKKEELRDMLDNFLSE